MPVTSIAPEAAGINLLPGGDVEILDPSSNVEAHFSSSAPYLLGSGSPEGVFTSGPGGEYRDVVSGYTYRKRSGTGNTGWQQVVDQSDLSGINTSITNLNTEVAAFGASIQPPAAGYILNSTGLNTWGSPSNVLTLAGLTGATAAFRLVGATTGGAPTSGTFAVGDALIDQLGPVWVCIVAGTPGSWTPVFVDGFIGGGTTRYYTTPREIALANRLQATTGDVVYTYFNMRRSYVATSLGILVATAAAGTPTLHRLGIYQVNQSTFDLTPWAHTAVSASLFSTSGLREAALVSNNLDGTAGSFPTSISLVRNTIYCIATISVAGTQPFFNGPAQAVGAQMLNSPPLAGKIAGQTDIGGGNAGASTVLFSSLANGTLMGCHTLKA